VVSYVQGQQKIDSQVRVFHKMVSYGTSDSCLETRQRIDSLNGSCLFRSLCIGLLLKNGCRHNALRQKVIQYVYVVAEGQIVQPPTTIVA
jgi:hypothetical protein